jgi:hypothetical protein
LILWYLGEKRLSDYSSTIFFHSSLLPNVAFKSLTSVYKNSYLMFRHTSKIKLSCLVRLFTQLTGTHANRVRTRFIPRYMCLPISKRCLQPMTILIRTVATVTIFLTVQKAGSASPAIISVTFYYLTSVYIFLHGGLNVLAMTIPNAVLNYRH